jgi:hypothetical protein
MYPNVKIVATTLREVHSTNRHSWGAVAWIDGKTYQSPTCELDVLDRVGGGDGFAAGFFYGLLSGASEQEAVNLGWAHGALLTTFPGDTTMATVDQVRAFAKGGSVQVLSCRACSMRSRPFMPPPCLSAPAPRSPRPERLTSKFGPGASGGGQAHGFGHGVRRFERRQDALRVRQALESRQGLGVVGIGIFGPAGISRR